MFYVSLNKPPSLIYVIAPIDQSAIKGHVRHTSMLQIVIILGWLVAFGMAIYFALQAIKHRLSGR